MKYVGGIKRLLKKQVESPNDEFVRYFFKELCPENNFVGQLKEDFLGYTLRAIKEFIREEIENLLDEAAKPKSKTEPEETELLEIEEASNKLEFTEDEREGYYIIRAILSSVLEPSRITYKDTVNYCNILLDNNNWRQIVRLHFNNSKNKKLEIFSIDDDGKKVSDKISIDSLNEIYNYTDQFKAIVNAYEDKA